MQSPVRVLLVDDNSLFREGVARMLRADPRFTVIGQASRGVDAVQAAESLRPDLILIDLKMPGMSGLEAIRRIRQDDAEVAIAVLTVFETADIMDSAREAGASGYLPKDSTPAQLTDEAYALAVGRHTVAERTAGELLPAAIRLPRSGVLATLTPREIQVLIALATGADNRAIAGQLGISPKTLRNHISNAYHKLQIYDRAQAVIVAMREGLVEVGRSRPDKDSASQP
jgi:DNA-binding NarL/FixJ family response regulator